MAYRNFVNKKMVIFVSETDVQLFEFLGTTLQYSHCVSRDMMKLIDTFVKHLCKYTIVNIIELEAKRS